MNTNNFADNSTESKDLKATLIDDTGVQTFLNFIFDFVKKSQERYEVKKRLIESATDLTTREKNEELDKAYNCMKQEQRQFIISIISVSTLGTIFVSLLTNPTFVNKARKLITI